MSTQKSWSDQIEFWLSWMLVLGISWPGIAILTSLLSNLFALADQYELNLVLMGLFGGALLGVVQWLFLRPSEQGAGLFFLGTTIGWAAGLMAVMYRVGPADPALLSLSRGFLAGLVLGLFQWSFLRAELRNGWVWLLMSAMSWTLAMAAGGLLANTGTISAAYETIAMGSLAALMGWVILGLLACVFLIALFPQQREREPDNRVRMIL